jgi:hypothetical protein
MSACPTCESVRVEIARDATSATFRCPWCRQVGREVHDPIRDALQGEFERREESPA